MSAFTVEFENRSGELARLCEAMVAPGVNSVVCAAAHGDTGTVAIIADDGEGCQDALEGADIESDERPPSLSAQKRCRGRCEGFSEARRCWSQHRSAPSFECRAEEFSAAICAEYLRGCQCARRSDRPRLRLVLVNNPSRSTPPITEAEVTCPKLQSFASDQLIRTETITVATLTASHPRELGPDESSAWPRPSPYRP